MKAAVISSNDSHENLSSPVGEAVGDLLGLLVALAVACVVAAAFMRPYIARLSRAVRAMAAAGDRAGLSAVHDPELCHHGGCDSDPALVLDDALGPRRIEVGGSVPKAMNKSLRTCGNGGGFRSPVGIGASRWATNGAFVTDLNRTVCCVSETGPWWFRRTNRRFCQISQPAMSASGDISRRTRWTLSGRGSIGADALSHWCAAYWFPLYAYVRRHGFSKEDAEMYAGVFREAAGAPGFRGAEAGERPFPGSCWRH